MTHMPDKLGDRAPETPAASLWVVLARAYRSMQTFVERSVSALDIGLSDFMILEALLHKGPMTMSALCDAVLLANASMTSAVDRLEQRSFVARAASKTDRRVRLVHLTPEGVTLIKRLYARHEKDLEAVMSGVTPAERAQVRQALKSIGLAAQAAAARDRN
jgi:MarR family 2-MHQ and catechol resistance regulon transcriptional repressor